MLNYELFREEKKNKQINVVVVVLGYYDPPTAKVIGRRDLGFKVSSKILEKPGFDFTTPVYEYLNHYATEASNK